MRGRRNWDEVAADQAGMISRTQALDGGLTRDQLRHRLRSRRWQPVGTGVYATFTGPLPPISLLWAALLRAGDGAVAGPHASLWLGQVLDRPPAVMDVAVPGRRRVRTGGKALVGVRRRADLETGRQPTSRPPRLRIEEAVLDAATEIDRPEPVIDLVLRAVQRGRTTPGRLAARLAARPRQRWRRLIADLVDQASDGVRSPLERHWVLGVERRHGLPAGRLNHREVTADGIRYRDVDYPWGLICELDGRKTYPDHAEFRDRRRDNRVTVSGRSTLRYGWREVVGDPCGVAAEVGDMLRRLGWTGSARPCTPACHLTPS